MNSQESDPTGKSSKRFGRIRNFTNGVVDGVTNHRMILAAVVGGAAVLGGQAVFHDVQSSPATISGVVRHVEPVPGEDRTFDNGVQVVTESGFKVTLDVCKSTKSIDIESGKGTNNEDCHSETGFLTESEINGKVKSLAEGTVVTIDSEDFFSLGEIRINR